MIKIEYKVKVSGGVGSPYQHLNGDFVSTHDTEGPLRDMITNVQDGEYGDIVEEDWTSKPSELTKGKVNHFNIKSFSQLGPYGVYYDTNKGSRLKIPIRSRPDLPEVDDVSIKVDGDYLLYDISGEILEYDNIRIKFSNGERDFDFIVSEPSGKMLIPYNMKGDFSFTAVGYRNEVQKFSSPSSKKFITIQ